MATLHFNKGFKILEGNDDSKFFFKNVCQQFSTEIINEVKKYLLPLKETRSSGPQMSV